MPGTLEAILKPEYLLQPTRLVRRVLGRVASPDAKGTYVIPLPWGVSMAVDYRDDLAQTVDVLGIYDLVVTEAIWRLLQPGDTALDVGANVGYMSLVMAARMRTSGRIFAFEPHPQLFGELSRNVERARDRFPSVLLRPRQEALSDADGTAWLHVPPLFAKKRGVSSVRDTKDGIEIRKTKLDAHASEIGGDVALMKIDVEGHEPAVFQGGRTMLETGVVRHVILEEHGRYPTESSTLLESLGFRVFGLERTLLRPRLVHPSRLRRSGWEAPNLIATRRPDALIEAFRRPGWRCLTARTPGA